MRRKGLEDLNVYRHQQEQGEKVQRTLICSGGCGALRGTGPRATGPGARFFVVRGSHAYTNAMQVFLHRLPCPHDRALILFILSILAILLQTIAIKGLTDLFSLLLRCSIDIQVFQTFAPCCCCLILNILAILFILAILLQTECMRGTGPRATGAEARFFVARGVYPQCFFFADLVSLQRQAESSSFHINRIARC